MSLVIVSSPLSVVCSQLLKNLTLRLVDQAITRRRTSGIHGKPGEGEVMVERKDSSNLVFAHENKRNAVGETHALIRKFLEILQSGKFILLLGPMNL
jgi:hypothetical protein